MIFHRKNRNWKIYLDYRLGKSKIKLFCEPLYIITVRCDIMEFGLTNIADRRLLDYESLDIIADQILLPIISRMN